MIWCNGDLQLTESSKELISLDLDLLVPSLELHIESEESCKTSLSICADSSDIFKNIPCPVSGVFYRLGI